MHGLILFFSKSNHSYAQQIIASSLISVNRMTIRQKLIWCLTALHSPFPPLNVLISRTQQMPVFFLIIIARGSEMFFFFTASNLQCKLIYQIIRNMYGRIQIFKHQAQRFIPALPEAKSVTPVSCVNRNYTFCVILTALSLAALKLMHYLCSKT